MCVMKRMFVMAVMFCSLHLHALGSYNDVAVIVNTNSAASQTIGQYFRQARNIPAINMIYVQVDTTEEVSEATFQLLRSQIESHLLANGIKNTINYLVTTKGVPLKINRGATFSTTSPSASVESELMLILGQYASYIGGGGPQMSPYFYENATFSKVVYDIYLVTRLDAYTVNDVLSMIDRSGPNVPADPNGVFLFDQDPAWSSPLNTYMARAKTWLEARGRTVVLDATTTYQTRAQNLLGYMSWGSNDHYQHLFTQNAIPYNTYARGALAETYVSTSGRSFYNPPQYGQSLIVDLIHEGVSGAKGYVYEPYSNAMAHAYLLFDRYAAGFNLAESYFMASLLVSWMDVVVGDPKTSITFSPSSLPVQLASFTGSVLPQSQSLRFDWRTISEINNFGFYLQRKDPATLAFEDVPNSFVAGHGTTSIPREYFFTYTNAPAGTAYYRLRQVDLDGTEYFSEPIVVANGVVSSVTASGVPAAYSLAQNYPNPFNPATRIRFSLRESENVRLDVFDATGKRVATLVNESLPSGEHSLVFDGTGLASGVYYYRIVAGSFSETRRMVLTK